MQSHQLLESLYEIEISHNDFIEEFWKQTLPVS